MNDRYLEVTLTSPSGAYHLAALDGPPSDFADAVTLCGKATHVGAGLRTDRAATCRRCLDINDLRRANEPAHPAGAPA